MALLERGTFLGQLSSLMASARHGRGRLVLVVGEAGIGKTSLVDAFVAVLPTPTRVLWGTCDPISPPRPFGPIVDIAERLGGELRRALAEGRRDRVVESFLAVLQRPGAPPTLVVLDDVHWADEATLGLLQVLGRRVARLPALVVATYRDHDVGPDHPLRPTLGDIPMSAVTHLRLPPLSVDAVGRLSRGRLDARALHRVTGGNPFFVTEVLAADPPSSEPVPASVRDAVLARLARLSPAAKQVLRAAAVLGPGSGIRTVLEVAGRRSEALDECIRHALVVPGEGVVNFRHELLRRSVLDGLSHEEIVRLNRAALAVLRGTTPDDWPRLARHAVDANDPAAVLELAPAAAGSAEGLGAHREALAFYRAALQYGDRLDEPERANLHESLARQASLVDDAAAALASQRAALSIWQAAGDPVREGACLTALSGYQWLAGDVETAMSAAIAGAALLEVAAPGSTELAWARATVAQRQVVSGGNDRQAHAMAMQALELAEELGDERTAVHALTSAAVARIYLGDADGWTLLAAVVDRARAANLGEAEIRAIINLVEAARDLRRYDLAGRYLAEASAFLERHELDLYHHILRSRVAALELEAGRWDAAAAHAAFLLDLAGTANPIRVRALTVRGLVRARRVEPGAWADLDEALRLTEGEPQDLVTLRAARAEAAWLEEDWVRARDEAALGLELGDREVNRWWWSELALWGRLAGADAPLPHPDERPYWLHATGRPVEAAAAWNAIGAPYQEALALASSDDERDLRRALRTFNLLGARTLARRVAGRLVALGAVRIDRGPRARTRANPAQLTSRQLEILGLLVEGLSDADIATRLVISGKTVGHHVSAILGKLGVPNRTAAAEAARRLDLVGRPDVLPEDGEMAAAT